MIIILGMAGAGKSTQCKKLAESGLYRWFSVGEHLRSIETGEARAEMMQGKILDNNIVTPIVQAELARLGDDPEILLDGCPRTVEQASWLASQTETPQISAVLHLLVDDATAIERLLKRAREDDSEQAMRVRFEGYHKDIGPVLGEFSAKSVPIIEIDASRDQDVVHAEIIAKLEVLGR